MPEIICRGCGVPVVQRIRPQGGGRTSLYCSARCRSRMWALAHIPDIPDTLTEDEMDAAVIAFGGAVAAGDVRS